jgi:hypothetical protein
MCGEVRRRRRRPGVMIRTCCRLRTGIDVGVEDDAIFTETILELKGRNGIV